MIEKMLNTERNRFPSARAPIICLTQREIDFSSVRCATTVILYWSVRARLDLLHRDIGVFVQTPRVVVLRIGLQDHAFAHGQIQEGYTNQNKQHAKQHANTQVQIVVRTHVVRQALQVAQYTTQEHLAKVASEQTQLHEKPKIVFFRVLV